MMQGLKNTWVSYVLSVFFQTSKRLLFFMVFINILFALIPMFHMIALANLIDLSIEMQKEGFLWSVAAPSIVVIIVLLIIKNFSSKANSLISVSFINRLRIEYTMKLSEKQAKLEYKHLENPESLDLITRVMDSPEQKLYDCLLNLIGIGSLYITIISLASTIIYYAWYIGLLLIIVAIPLMIVAVRGGRATYEANKISTKYIRKYQYYGQVLTSREASLERALFGYGAKLKSNMERQF